MLLKVEDMVFKLILPDARAQTLHHCMIFLSKCSLLSNEKEFKSLSDICCIIFVFVIYMIWPYITV